MILYGFISIRLSLGARAFYIRARMRAPRTAENVLTVRAHANRRRALYFYIRLLYRNKLYLIDRFQKKHRDINYAMCVKEKKSVYYFQYYLKNNSVKNRCIYQDRRERDA